MIGNDVVDLALARKESNWKRKGFLDKIFTASEQAIILNSEDRESTVWNLWSRKEAAYKIYNRATGIRGFFPLEIECLYKNESSGSVNCRGMSYFTRTEIDNKSIHTVAVSNKIDFGNIELLDNRIGIGKSKGIPYFNNENNPVSISHHGKFRQIITLKLQS